MSAHPECTGLEKKWKHATKCGNAFKEHDHKFCEQFKTMQSTANVQKDGPKISGKKISEKNSKKKKFLFKDGKKNH